MGNFVDLTSSTGVSPLDSSGSGNFGYLGGVPVPFTNDPNSLLGIYDPPFIDPSQGNAGTPTYPTSDPTAAIGQSSGPSSSSWLVGLGSVIGNIGSSIASINASNRPTGYSYNGQPIYGGAQTAPYGTTGSYFGTPANYGRASILGGSGLLLIGGIVVIFLLLRK